MGKKKNKSRADEKVSHLVQHQPMILHVTSIVNKNVMLAETQTTMWYKIWG